MANLLIVLFAISLLQAVRSFDEDEYNYYIPVPQYEPVEDNYGLQCSKTMEDMKTYLDSGFQYGVLNQIVERVCKFKPLIEDCLHMAIGNAINLTKPVHVTNTYSMMQVIHQAIEFLCVNENYTFTKFLNDGGLRCIVTYHQYFTKCFLNSYMTNSSMTIYYDDDDDNIEDDGTKTVSVSECDQIFQFQTCVIAKLKKCLKPSTDPYISAFFEFIRRSLPCDKMKQSTSGASTSFNTFFVMSLVVSLNLLKYSA